MISKLKFCGCWSISVCSSICIPNSLLTDIYKHYSSVWNILSVTSTDRFDIFIAESIEFGSTEKCGGKLVVKYRDQWEYVCGKLNANDTEKVCKKLNCSNVEKPVDEREISKEINVAINCLEQSQSLSQCARFNKKCTLAPAEIQCEGKKKMRGKSSFFCNFLNSLIKV